MISVEKLLTDLRATKYIMILNQTMSSDRFISNEDPNKVKIVFTPDELINYVSAVLTMDAKTRAEWAE